MSLLEQRFSKSTKGLWLGKDFSHELKAGVGQEQGLQNCPSLVQTLFLPKGWEVWPLSCLRSLSLYTTQTFWTLLRPCKSLLGAVKRIQLLHTKPRSNLEPSETGKVQGGNARSEHKFQPPQLIVRDLKDSQNLAFPLDPDGSFNPRAPFPLKHRNIKPPTAKSIISCQIMPLPETASETTATLTCINTRENAAEHSVSGPFVQKHHQTRAFPYRD